MDTIEATVSMLETMPEEARLLVFNYTQELFQYSVRQTSSLQ